jgi:hypothetical protein
MLYVLIGILAFDLGFLAGVIWATRRVNAAVERTADAGSPERAVGGADRARLHWLEAARASVSWALSARPVCVVEVPDTGGGSAGGTLREAVDAARAEIERLQAAAAYLARLGGAA